MSTRTRKRRWPVYRPTVEPLEARTPVADGLGPVSAVLATVAAAAAHSTPPPEFAQFNMGASGSIWTLPQPGAGGALGASSGSPIALVPPSQPTAVANNGTTATNLDAVFADPTNRHPALGGDGAASHAGGAHGAPGLSSTSGGGSSGFSFSGGASNSVAASGSSISLPSSAWERGSRSSASQPLPAGKQSFPTGILKPSLGTSNAADSTNQSSGVEMGSSSPLAAMSQTTGIIGGVAPTVPQTGDPEAAGDLVQMANGIITGMPSNFSSNPVRYFDGVVELSWNDLSSDAGGTPWGFTRSWSNGANYANGYNGSGMVVTQLPHLIQDGASTIDVVSNGYTIRYFDLSGSTYTERYFGMDTLVHNSAAHTFTLTDTQGDVITFNDFSSTLPTARQGTFASYGDPGGNTIAVTSYTSAGKPAEIQRSLFATGMTTIVESYLFSYIASGTNAGLMSSVVLRREPLDGSWTTVQQVAYTYYDGTDTHGNVGDLKLAVVEDPSGNALSTTYYRYYTGESGGYVHGLKYVFGPAAYNQLTAALGTSLSSLSDSSVAPYADNYFQYDSSQRVTEEIAAGAGASGGSTPGQGTFSYTYTASTNTPGLNSWAMKAVETLPDGNENIVYTNTAGEVMLFVYEDTGSSSQWDDFYEYDALGHVILAAQPSAITGYSDSYADLLHNVSGNYAYLNDSSGLITIYDYASSTTATMMSAGNVANYLEDTKVAQGETATAILQSGQQYIVHSGSSITIDPVASQTVYRNTGGSGGETTSYSYSWGSGNMPSIITTDAPVISSGENGPGSADASSVYLDSYGRVVWTVDGDGFLTYTAYDLASGAVVKHIDDVNTSDTGDFSGTPPASTPSGGGLELITTWTVDALGRPTKETDPNGNITYMVYDDPDHEERIYAGWNSGSGTPTGPTQVIRYDAAGGYDETLTMSATPHLTSGVPDGTEAIGSVQSLSRTYYNSGGQVSEEDDYFNLSGLTYSTSTSLGTSGTNYYATVYGYDADGRENRVQYPTGTIDRTVYDGQGRQVSTWEGTDDTPSSGSWSPTNNSSPSNMVELTSDVYDGGSVGDGNLTAEIAYPGGSAANRETDYFYDWRDRLVATKDGVQTSEDSTTHRPIMYYTLDNLGEVTETQQFDGDGVTISYSGGVPSAPSSSLLRAETATSYDDQGRVYESQEYDVNPSTGSVSTYALTTNDYYNHRGELIEESDPGGLVTKHKYDGAGRETVTYTTDGAGGTSWSAASSVSSDNVLQQVESTYDKDGNVILTTTRERNHDETSTGALGNETTTPKARVYYTADYYDAANRLTAEVDVGTNGGSSYTRPSTVPTGSATVLVTSYTYNAAGYVDTTTDPRGIVEKEYYDNLGRVTKDIQDYTTGTVTNNTNKTTEYTYDGDGNTLTVTVDLPSSAYEETAYVYGVTTSGGSGVNSNDLLAATEYPDPSSGNPSTSSEETYTDNALGQTLTYSDRDGNVHTYSYDVLGRQTSDAVTTLGSGVDGTVRRIDTAYDTQGNAYLTTSYNAASGGSIVNQVEDVFNGLGQLTGEYQSHSGVVNTSTTPEVQYSYTEMSDGANNSRLTSMTYPNGYALDYNYNSGLDSTISRLSYLSDTSGTLQSYNYLGLDTPVIIDDPQPNIELTYVKQSGESNGDAGDQYTGLDRFGRVADQRWLNTSTSTATDRFQYGYDQDSNALYKNNVVNSSFSELYHANGSSNGYDNLNQLTNFARGTLNGSDDTISSPTTTNSWSTDAAGNYTSIGSTTVTVNKQNEATALGSATLSYDSSGDMTTDQNGDTLVYDAWSRLVAYKNGGTTLESISYDGLSRRVVDNPGTATDLYYSAAGQELEEQVSGAAKVHYVWSPVGANGLVLRDRDTGGGTLSERLWVQQDVNGNVTSLVNGSGSVVERYVYDPNGSVTVLNGSWSTLSSSAYSWIYNFQAGRTDTTTGLDNFGYRDESPTSARWTTPDPTGFGGGDVNLYRSLENNPIGYIDPSGLQGINLDQHYADMKAMMMASGQVTEAFADAYIARAKQMTFGGQYDRIQSQGLSPVVPPPGFLDYLGGEVQIAFGIGEVAIGMAGGPFTAPIATHGVDNVVHGSMQLWDGRHHATWTEQAGTNIATTLGAEPKTAQVIGSQVDNTFNALPAGMAVQRGVASLSMTAEQRAMMGGQQAIKAAQPGMTEPNAAAANPTGTAPATASNVPPNAITPVTIYNPDIPKIPEPVKGGDGLGPALGFGFPHPPYNPDGPVIFPN